MATKIFTSQKWSTKIRRGDSSAWLNDSCPASQLKSAICWNTVVSQDSKLGLKFRCFFSLWDNASRGIFQSFLTILLAQKSADMVLLTKMVFVKWQSKFVCTSFEFVVIFNASSVQFLASERFPSSLWHYSTTKLLMFTLVSKLDCTLVLFQRTNLGFGVKSELKNGIQKRTFLRLY